MSFRLNGYYQGIKTLVPFENYTAEQDFTDDGNGLSRTQKWIQKLTGPDYPSLPPMDPVVYSPYPDYQSEEFLAENVEVQTCYLEEEHRTPVPDVMAYPGIPQNMSEPYFGSYSLVGLPEDVCYDRYGRLGAYGFGYSKEEGGLGFDEDAEHAGWNKVWDHVPQIDYRRVDWGKAQQACVEKNKRRFEASDDGKERMPRTAFVLRTYSGYKYEDRQMAFLRSLISELSLKSGGEYEVHFLVHIKDDSRPIWASEKAYREALEESLPREFWGMATLWSEQLMKSFYPPPFDSNLDNPSKTDIHGVYRSAHFPLQWFSQQHKEYDYFWNWEMDVRTSGHNYEFHQTVVEWAKKQPRKGLWERNAKYYIPRQHGTWDDFVEMVEQESLEAGSPIWGPVEFPNSGMMPHPNGTEPPRRYLQDNYEWGVGEEADLVVFNPLFPPDKTNWVFRDDVSGYDLTLDPPPRRTAIITIARLSRRLLDTMHEETWKMKHHMFPEMWPPSVALHHGLKAVYVPHPIYFDREWPLDTLDAIFNRPKKPQDSPFGWGEHNQQGSSFYYNSGFSGALWRRWWGNRVNNEGGSKFEAKGSGRLCLRTMLFHPIKFEVDH